MYNEYLARAREVMPDAKELIVVASRIARRLALGARPMVRCNEQNSIDVALLEIAEGKLTSKVGNSDDFLKEIEAVKQAHAREMASMKKMSEDQ